MRIALKFLVLPSWSIHSNTSNHQITAEIPFEATANDHGAPYPRRRRSPHARNKIQTQHPVAYAQDDEEAHMTETKLRPAIHPFAGSVGDNQQQVLDRNDPSHFETLKRVPDAGPYVKFPESLDPLPGYLAVEIRTHRGCGYYASCLRDGLDLGAPAAKNGAAVETRRQTGGDLWNSGLFRPSDGRSVVSGAHVNPMISIAAFFARLIALPRLVLYITAQVAGGSFAGLALKAAYGSGDFIVGGCAMDTKLVPTRDAFVLEFMFCLTLIFLAFGVGLDPRQGGIYGATLSPWLVGIALALLSWCSSFTRPGYYGASMNPARCFGVYEGSTFLFYHWIHWVGPIAASMGHGVIYASVPPWYQAPA
ncbi:hypothetical protein AJ80_00932 [Polytolypa hystricis UAMH7299]|uniref:Aquaporin n=1 Tax=Polytolypa hystricis (strain UAMH7299) TaxID=1447883 RepID=A0A2B7Z2K8_POLH7|nr:hypothetical protein AJ80_00932 [Polytolypa hystricis UAMH7299]